MKYSIVFSSKTGNTAKLAQTLKEFLPQDDCLYFGNYDTAILADDIVFVGFWTDRGSCDKATEEFLQTLQHRQVFLFGTAGFGGDKKYFEKILENVSHKLDASNKIIGSFMCQGKMPITVLERYEKMITTAPDPAPIQEMINNFHKAVNHPDQLDFESLLHSVTNFVCVPAK